MKPIRIVDLDTRKLALTAEVAVPNGGSAGEWFLLELKYYLFDFLRYPPDTGESIEKVAMRLADDACDTNAETQWSTFVDLEAWKEEIDLKGQPLEEAAFATLHQIARRILTRILSETPRVVTLISIPPGGDILGEDLTGIKTPWIETLKRPAVKGWLDDHEGEVIFAVTDPSVKVPSEFPALVITIF